MAEIIQIEKNGELQYPITKPECVIDENGVSVSDLIKGKQDEISDLATIRSNASKGATALQSVPAEYVTETELTNKGYATTASVNTALGDKVDKVSGKQLSTEDFTTALKNKLSSLNNYDDTAINNAISSLQTQLNTLVSGDANTAIESFNEIIAFLDGVTDTQTLEGIIAGIEQQIAGKQDTITDLATIRSGAAKGATALQSHQDISGKLDKTEAASTYVPRSGGSLNDGASLTFSLYGTRTLKVTGNSIEVDMSKDTGGWAGTFASIKDPLNDVTTILGWYGGTGGLTHIFMGGSYNDPAMKMGKNGQFTFRYSPKVGNKTIATVEDLAKVATSGSYNDLSDKPTIPSAVTESTVSGWGFTKNTGTYSKPSTGIPKTDLASAVQTSLSKADTALQSYTETDPVFKASAAAGITSSDISNWNSKTSNTGTITGIKMNGASKGTSGVVDLGTVITSHQDISGKQDKLVSGTNIKTINGTSILGSGDIAISSGSSAYPLVSITGSDITMTLQPNTFYVFPSSGARLTLDFDYGDVFWGDTAKEFVFMVWGSVALTLNKSVKWVGDAPPVFKSNKTYQISVLGAMGVAIESDLIF